MIAENKYKWMVWAIVILAAMNIATVMTIVYNRYQTDKEETPGQNNQVSSESNSIQYSGRYFREQLNLSSSQMEKFVEFNPVFRQQAMTINYELNRLRQQMLTEMTTEHNDTLTLNALADSIGYLHADLKKITYKYYIDFKTICDPQQQEKLEQLFSGMFASDGRMGQHGRGAQQGRHRGRPFNNN